MRLVVRLCLYPGALFVIHLEDALDVAPGFIAALLISFDGNSRPKLIWVLPIGTWNIWIVDPIPHDAFQRISDLLGSQRGCCVRVEQVFEGTSHGIFAYFVLDLVLVHISVDLIFTGVFESVCEYVVKNFIDKAQQLCFFCFEEPLESASFQGLLYEVEDFMLRQFIVLTK